MKILPLILLGLLVACGAAHGETMVVPASRENVEGTQSINEPFGVEIDYRAQQVYGPSLFPVLPNAANYRISGVAFRFSIPLTGGFPSFDEATFDRVKVDISTAPRVFPTGSSIRMDENHGSDRMTVFDRPTTFGGMIPPIGPAAFDLRIGFDIPFDFDPAKGSLILDITKYGNDSIRIWIRLEMREARLTYRPLLDRTSPRRRTEIRL